MLVLEIALVLLAMAGHVTVWVAAVNRIHALAGPQWLVDGLTCCCWGFLLLAPVGLAVIASSATTSWSLRHAPWYVLCYVIPCCAVALAALRNRIHHACRRRQLRVLLANHTTSVDLVDALGHRPVHHRSSRVLTRLPGNETLVLTIHEETLGIRRLHPALDGLRIAHLSDLHLSGRLGKAFFQEIVARTNRLRPDLVAITGDLFDQTACVDWGAETLGRLASRYGVFFVLGNHDLRVDEQHARRQLTACGLVDLGGRWRRIDVGGRPLVLAGNELPWFAPAADMDHCPGQFDGQRALRLLLAHAPDQVDWARRFDFDLMLAGHTHGGQIRLPLLGSVFTPSRWGTTYAAGLYDLPPTVLHVSRGISSLTLLRWNCPPELALLVLRRAAPGPDSGQAAS
ncbi:MAG: hypothetical protein A2W31_02915 [Planctomycetes bacterium RBG_16_64_10]|nr:MAG: hypothetical protein A2W31_02915 [Planctomycetes bacterium RBG_16_64_10]